MQLSLSTFVIPTWGDGSAALSVPKNISSFGTGALSPASITASTKLGILCWDIYSCSASIPERNCGHTRFAVEYDNEKPNTGIIGAMNRISIHPYPPHSVQHPAEGLAMIEAF